MGIGGLRGNCDCETQNAVFFVRGKRHDNKNLKVQFYAVEKSCECGVRRLLLSGIENWGKGE